MTNDAPTKVTHHPPIPGNVLYFGMGKPCPRCKKVWFSCSHDLGLHLRVCDGPNDLGWRKSKYDNGQIVPSEKDIQLKQEIIKNGSITMGRWKYSLSQDGQWLKRKLAGVEDNIRTEQ